MKTDFVLPPELNQPVPRNVRASKLFRWSLVGMTFFSILIIGVLTGWGLYSAKRQEILQQRGVTVEGHVTNKWLTYRKHGQNYHVGYVFVPSVANAAPVKDDMEVASSFYNEMKIGQTAPVIYDPQDLTNSRFNFNDIVHKQDPYLLFYTVIVRADMLFGVIYLVGMLIFVCNYLRQKKLMMWGSCAKAMIVGEREYRNKNGRFMTVTYEFTDQGGETVRNDYAGLPTRDDPAPKSVAKLINLLDNPIVIYDPAKSRRNMLYPTAQYVDLLPPESL